jgi:hypothetical protein
VAEQDTRDPAPILEDDPVLGSAVAHYPSNRLRLLRIAALIYAPIAIVINLAFLPVDAAVASIIVIGGMAVVAMAVGWWVLHYWNREVVLYERGFSYREGSHTAHLLYHEVEAIRLHAEQIGYFGGLIRRTIHRLTLKTAQDETIVLDNTYNHIEQLAARIEKQVNRELHRRVNDSLEQGKTVSFGPSITLTPEGLRAGSDAAWMPWTDFTGWSVQGGRLTLRTQTGQEFALPLAEIDNLTLLVSLLHERSQQYRNED